MSQFEKAVKLSDEQFLRAVGVDKTTFNLILERVAVYLESVREERPMKNRKHLLESNLQTIIIDATEQPIERPTKGQRAYYSGKKTAHNKSSIDCVFGDVRNIIGYLPQRECSRLQNSEGKPSGGFPRN